MSRTRFSDRLRYAFDNSMSRGAIALIGYLGLASICLIAFFALIVVLFHIAPKGGDQPGFMEAAWLSLMRTLDSGTMGGDEGWSFRVPMLGVTLGGIFLVSALIGVINNGLDLLNVSSYYQQVIKGLIIVGAVWLDRSRKS